MSKPMGRPRKHPAVVKTHAPLPESNTLPTDARAALRAALQVDPQFAPAESFDRTRALDQAIGRVKQKYPNLFR